MSENYEKLVMVVDKITSTNEKERLSLLKYGARLNDYLVVKAIKKGDEFFYDNRKQNKEIGRGVLIYCGLIKALKKYKYADQEAMHRKATDVHIASMEELSEGRRIAAIRRRSKSSKRNQIQEHLSDLVKFQREGYSLRDMVEYLHQQKLDVSRETIRRQLNAIQNNN